MLDGVHIVHSLAVLRTEASAGQMEEEGGPVAEAHFLHLRQQLSLSCTSYEKVGPWGAVGTHFEGPPLVLPFWSHLPVLGRFQGYSEVWGALVAVLHLPLLVSPDQG